MYLLLLTAIIRIARDSDLAWVSMASNTSSSCYVSQLLGRVGVGFSGMALTMLIRYVTEKRGIDESKKVSIFEVFSQS